MVFSFIGSAPGIVVSIGTTLFNILFFKLPWDSPKTAKLLNVFFLVLTSVIAYILSIYGHYFLSTPGFKNQKELGYSIISALGLTSNETENEHKLLGFYVIFRVLLGSAIYHLLQSIALIGVNSSSHRRSIIQDGLWPIKAFTLIGCCVACFYIPPSMFYTLFYVALMGASLCTLIQAFLLVDAAYDYAGYLITSYEDTSKERYKYILIGLTVTFNALIAGGSIYLFTRFESAFDRFCIGFNLFSSIGISVLSTLSQVQEINPSAGIFQSSLLGAYNIYLLVLGMLNRTGVDDVQGVERSVEILTMIGYFTAIFFAAFAALSTGQASNKLFITDPNDNVSDGTEDGEDYNRSYFHFVFLLTALQLAIMMNMWRAPLIDEVKKTIEIVDLDISFYLKLFTTWVIYGLYLWTLFAPYFFPDREFY